MRTILFVLLGWIGGHLLGSGFLKIVLVFFDMDASNVSFITLLLPYLSALVLAIVLPLIDQKKKKEE